VPKVVEPWSLPVVVPAREQAQTDRAGDDDEVVPFTSIPKLRPAILDYVASHNERNKPFRWTKTADEILDKMRRFGLCTQRVYE
jgi:hypothetical protein